MVEMSTVRTLWKASIKFYERFVRALLGEHTRRPICHLAGPEQDSSESIPDPRRSRLSTGMGLMMPLCSCLAILMLFTAGEVEAQKAVNAPTFHTSVEMVLVPVTV